MNSIEERKAYLLRRNEIAKELLTQNLSNIDLSSYLMPDIGYKVDEIPLAIATTFRRLANKSNFTTSGLYALIGEWTLKIRNILKD